MEDRDRVYRRILTQPNQTLQAENLAQARSTLGLDEMTMGTFKSSLRHLVHPSATDGETRRAYYTRRSAPEERKSSRPLHVWRAVTAAD